ncbi:MAG: hypothetical protein ORN57_04040, partial [Alphaproteobacteria bacterium]|nr:hypothetical protein [Alphaproteobacteria bacterium]
MIKNWLRHLLTIVVLLMAVFAISNGVSIGRAILTGQEQSILPPPYSFFHGWEKVFKNSGNNSQINWPDCYKISPNCFGVAGKFGVDYAGGYFPAQFYKSTGVIYDLRHDTWQRIYNGTPVSYWLLSHSFLTDVDFAPSHVYFMIFQTVIFIMAFLYYTRHKKDIYKKVIGLVFVFFALTATPLGEYFIIDGQYYLFNGAAILLVLAGWRDNRLLDFLLAGFIAAMRFSFLPPLFFILASLAIFSLRNFFITGLSWSKMIAYSKTYGKRLVGGFTVGIIPILLFAIFPRNELVTFITWLEDDHYGRPPTYFSMARHIHPWQYFIIIMMLIILYFFLSLLYQQKKEKTRVAFQSISEPIFWCGLGFVASQWGNAVFEYVLVQLLFVVGLLVDKGSLLYADNDKAIAKFTYPRSIWFLWIFLYLFILRLYEFFSPWPNLFNSLHSYGPLTAIIIA